MNIKELIQALEKYPKDTEVVVAVHSDYELLTPDGLSVIQGVNQTGWIMQYHPTMSLDNKTRVKEYLCLRG